MNNLKIFIFKILSYFPILRVTDDVLFGEVKNESLDRLRISFISFNLGKRIIHLITFNTKNRELKFLKIINLEEVCNYLNDKADQAYDLYKAEINNYSQEKILIHKEALMYKIGQLEGTKSKTFNKYVAYIAIITLILPLYGTQLNKLHIFIDDYKVLYLIALIYILINLFLFFNDFMKVRGYNRTLFNSIRISDTPLNELTASLYYEWCTIKSESNFQVTLIKNIEKYMRRFIIISVLLLVSHTLEQHFEETYYSEKDFIEDSSTLIQFVESNSNKNFMKINNLKLTKLKDKMLYSNLNEIIILYNEENSSVSVLKNYLKIYNDESFDIILIKSNNIQGTSIIVIEED